MKQTTIEGYTNSRPLYNLPGFLAQALSNRIGKWTKYNVLMGFKPPKLGATVLISPKLPAPEEALDNSLFTPGMLLHDRPLNFYISVNAEPEPFLINAGYLLAHFAFSERVGYQELKRLLSAKVQPELREIPEEVVEIA